MKKVDVSLERELARVEFDDASISAERLAAVIEQIGFRPRLLGVQP